MSDTFRVKVNSDAVPKKLPFEGLFGPLNRDLTQQWYA